MWVQNIQRAIDYIEENLCDDISIEDVAKEAYSSTFHFQRVFSILCGFTVSDYIRNRRLANAALDLLDENTKVIDVDFKYGSEKISFKVNSEATTTVGTKIKDIKKTNTIDVNGISDEDMVNIYTKFMEKVDPVVKDIVPNYDLSSIMEALA